MLVTPFGVSRLKTSSAGAFLVLFRAFSRRTLTGDNVLILDLVLLEGKKICRATPTKQDLGTSWSFFFFQNFRPAPLVEIGIANK